MFEDKKQKPAVMRPDPVSELVKVLTIARRKPPMFPADPVAAAKYWINHQEPGDDYREAMTEIIKDGEVIGWNAPYIDRLRHNLRIFLQLPKIHQQFAIHAVENNIPWRGDGHEMFVGIVHETEKMRQNPEEYKSNAAKIAKKVLP